MDARMITVRLARYSFVQWDKYIIDILSIAISMLIFMEAGLIHGERFLA
jgi:hypothetical protein